MLWCLPFHTASACMLTPHQCAAGSQITALELGKRTELDECQGRQSSEWFSLPPFSWVTPHLIDHFPSQGAVEIDVILIHLLHKHKCDWCLHEAVTRPDVHGCSGPGASQGPGAGGTELPSPRCTWRVSRLFLADGMWEGHAASLVTGLKDVTISPPPSHPTWAR